MGTVRIFIAPKTDEKGNKLTFDEQRLLMIEMDKFSQPREYLLELSLLSLQADNEKSESLSN